MAKGRLVGELQELIRRRAVERLTAFGLDQAIAEAAAALIVAGIPESVAIGDVRKAPEARTMEDMRT